MGDIFIEGLEGFHIIEDILIDLVIAVNQSLTLVFRVLEVVELKFICDLFTLETCPIMQYRFFPIFTFIRDNYLSQK